MSTVGENIQKKRIERNLSQNKLAKAAGIAQATLSTIESSTKSPSVDTVQKLANGLDCSVSELIGENMENSIFLTDRQRRLLSIFDQLNDAGKNSLLNLAESILTQPGFRQDARTQSGI